MTKSTVEIQADIAYIEIQLESLAQQRTDAVLFLDQRCNFSEINRKIGELLRKQEKLQVMAKTAR